jgi:hypothetical protein
MNPYSHTPKSTRGWYASAPRAAPSGATPSSHHAARSSPSTNIATNRAGWSAGSSSSSVGGNRNVLARLNSRSGIARPPTRPRLSVPQTSPRPVAEQEF